MIEHYKFENTPLLYAYDALEPYIDTQTMHLHHDKHLQTYIENLNVVLKNHPSLQCLSLEQLIRTAGRMPKAVGIPISRNAGGVYNHRFFFDGMTPNLDHYPDGKLANSIDKFFKSFDGFNEKFESAALSIFGSGYAWLTADRCGRLHIVTTANQDTPIEMGLYPIICIDVWEHAYYLKHYNKRADYIRDWFEVVDWRKASENYMACICAHGDFSNI